VVAGGWKGAPEVANFKRASTGASAIALKPET
jgi:hypothetical protein